MDVRHDLAIGEQILAFLTPCAPRSTVVADRIIGCPHEEGTDYPEGASCPQCPYWAGRDRFRIRLTIRPVGREGYGPVATGMKTDELYPAQTLASEPPSSLDDAEQKGDGKTKYQHPFSGVPLKGRILQVFAKVTF